MACYMMSSWTYTSQVGCLEEVPLEEEEPRDAFLEKVRERAGKKFALDL